MKILQHAVKFDAAGEDRIFFYTEMIAQFYILVLLIRDL